MIFGYPYLKIIESSKWSGGSSIMHGIEYLEEITYFIFALGRTSPNQDEMKQTTA